MNPVGKTLNSLGIYIVTSLMFVLVAKVEFAGMLCLQRAINVKEESRVGLSSETGQMVSFKIQKLSAKIDGAALILFPLAFIAFNVFYWAL